MPSRQVNMARGLLVNEFFIYSEFERYHYKSGIFEMMENFQNDLLTVEEVNSDKTKVPDEFIFRSVLLDCFTAEPDE